MKCKDSVLQGSQGFKKKVRNICGQTKSATANAAKAVNPQIVALILPPVCPVVEPEGVDPEEVPLEDPVEDEPEPEPVGVAEASG